MKDILNEDFIMCHRNNIVFDIVKDDEKETYTDKFLTPKIFGLEIENELKKKGYKLAFNHIENNNSENKNEKAALDLMFSCTSFNKIFYKLKGNKK